MSFSEQVSNLAVPVDKNGYPSALLTTVNPSTGVFSAVGAVALADGTSAMKTAPAAVASAALLAPVTVSATATAILAAAATRRGHVLFNAGNSVVYVGVANTVTTSTGIPVAPGASFNLDIPGLVYTGAIYGICGAGETSQIRGINYND